MDFDPRDHASHDDDRVASQYGEDRYPADDARSLGRGSSNSRESEHDGRTTSSRHDMLPGNAWRNETSWRDSLCTGMT